MGLLSDISENAKKILLAAAFSTGISGTVGAVEKLDVEKINDVPVAAEQNKNSNLQADLQELVTSDSGERAKENAREQLVSALEKSESKFGGNTYMSVTLEEARGPVKQDEALRIDYFDESVEFIPNTVKAVEDKILAIEARGEAINAYIDARKEMVELTIDSLASSEARPDENIDARREVIQSYQEGATDRNDAVNDYLMDQMRSSTTVDVLDRAVQSYAKQLAYDAWDEAIETYVDEKSESGMSRSDAFDLRRDLFKSPPTAIEVDSSLYSQEKFAKEIGESGKSIEEITAMAGKDALDAGLQKEYPKIQIVSDKSEEKERPSWLEAVLLGGEKIDRSNSKGGFSR
jgi:hypothetical protein